MSDIPQKPPFEETDEYKQRRYAFEREMYEALLAYKKDKLDIEQKFKDDCDKMSRVYDRGEL